ARRDLYSFPTRRSSDLGKVVTNDLGELVSEDAFRWLGRYDNIINSGGIKLIPEVIEDKVAQTFARLNMHNNFFIAGVPHERLGRSESTRLNSSHVKISY